MAEWKVINVGGVPRNRRVIDLRELGFEYRVSDKARAEIEAAERRSIRVIQTAHRFWFR